MKWAHDDQFLEYLDKFHIVCLAETFCSDAINLKGFEVVSHKPAEKQTKINCAQKGRRSGGLTIYSKLGLATKAVKPQDDSVMLACKLKEWCICFCYVPPQSSVYAVKRWDAGVEGNLLEICAVYNNKVLVCGDFNSRVGEVNEIRDELYSDKHVPFYYASHENNNIGKRVSKDTQVNCYGKKLVNICRNINFIILNGRNERDKEGELTFINHLGSSCLDLGLTHTDNFGLVSLAVGQQIFSSHMPLQIGIKTDYAMPTGTFAGKKIPIFRYKDSDKERILYNFTALNHEFNDIAELESGPDETLNKLLGVLSKTLAPVRVSTHGAGRKGKIIKSKLSINATKALDSLRRYRRSRGDIGARKEYLKFRASYKKETKALKHNKKRENEEEIALLYKQNNSGELWKRMSGAKTKSTNKMDGINPEKWVNHFDELYNVNFEASENWECDVENCPDVEDLDKEISAREIMTVVQKLSGRKASGRDGISNKIVKNFASFIVPVLVVLYNKILKTASYPVDWKVTLIFPIFKKKGSPSDTKNYRGIGIQTSFQKIFNKIIHKRLYEWVEKVNLLPKFQAGFRKNHSTIDQIFVLQTVVSKYLYRDQSLYCAYVDFSTFFDSIQRHILWAKLCKMKISKKTLKLLMNMYTDSKFSVKFKYDEISKTTESRTGCVQGDVLSPLLANLFTADLADHLSGIEYPHFSFLNNNELKMIQFADDVALISTTPIGLQRQLNSLQDYCRKNGLKVNTDKTKIMIFRNGRKPKYNAGWKYKDEKLEVVDSFRYLGITMTYNLKLNPHMVTAFNKSRVAMHTVSRFVQSKNKFPLKLALNLGQALVQSVFSYGIELLAWEDMGRGNQLMRTYYKKCLRLPLSAPSFGVELIVGRRSYSIFAVFRAIKFWRKIMGQNASILVKDALSEQQRQMEWNRNNWLNNVKHKLESIGMGNLWATPPLGKKGELLLSRVILNRLSDINFQDQLSEINKLKSLKHMENFKISSDGFMDLLRQNDSCRIRMSAQLLLNCPGSLVHRERDLLICTSCSSPIINRNVFLHIFRDCVNTPGEAKTVADKVNKNLPIPIQMSKLSQYYMRENNHRVTI